MTCPSCGAELPADARFCIECGLALPRANTDATVQLRPQRTVVRCAACGAESPGDARFCVRCGERIGAEARPAQIYARPAPAPLASAPRPAPAHHHARHYGHRGAGPLIPALFLVGLGLLLLTKTIWPGILLLVGITAFMGEAVRGRAHRGLVALVTMFGLATAFTVPRLFLPALIITVGLNILIGAARRSRRFP